MAEYCMEAIVLGRRSAPFGGGVRNFFADLYTKELGRIEARVPGGRKITSRLSPHLDFGTLVFVRLVRKNFFTLTDAFLEERFFQTSGEARDDFFRLAYLCRFLLPFGVPDYDIWEFFGRSLREEKISYTMFLSLLGYGGEDALCGRCLSRDAQAFFLPDQVFLCRSCALLFSEKEAVCFYR